MCKQTEKFFNFPILGFLTQTRFRMLEECLFDRRRLTVRRMPVIRVTQMLWMH